MDRERNRHKNRGRDRRNPGEYPLGVKSFPLWTVVTGSAAIACLGLGLGMGAASSGAYEEYETTDDQDRYKELRDSIETYDTMMAVSFATAGDLAITSAVIYLAVERKPATQPTAKAESSARVTPLLGLGAAGLRVEF